MYDEVAVDGGPFQVSDSKYQVQCHPEKSRRVFLLTIIFSVQSFKAQNMNYRPAGYGFLFSAHFKLAGALGWPGLSSSAFAQAIFASSHRFSILLAAQILL